MNKQLWFSSLVANKRFWLGEGMIEKSCHMLLIWNFSLINPFFEVVCLKGSKIELSGDLEEQFRKIIEIESLFADFRKTKNSQIVVL